MKTIATIVIPLLAFGLPARAGQLEDWLGEVVRNNPAIASSQAASDAAREAAKSVRAFDPPQIGFELFQSPVEGFPNPFYKQQELDWSVQQMFPFPGKRRAMAKPEELRSQMLLQEKRTREQALVRQFKDGYWDLWSLEERLRLMTARIRNLSEIADIAQRRFDGGVGTRTEALKARSELVALRVDSSTLSRERGSMQSMLLSLMGRSGEQSLDSIEAPVLPELASLPVLGPGFDSGRPDVAGMMLSAKMGEAMADASRRELLPDFMVRGMYKQMLEMDMDYWSVMVGITVPFAPWSISGPAGEARRRELESRRDMMEVVSMRNMAIAEARKAMNELVSSLESVRASDSLLVPQAELLWRSAKSEYDNGEGGFLMLLDAYRMSLMAREKRIMDAMQAMQALASLEQALGTGAPAPRNPSSSTTQGGSR